MFSILSGRLTAPFNLDGRHLHRYLAREKQIKNGLCEELILHDSLAIPTQDYLTACGLVSIIGENGLIELLEQGRISFIRLRGVFGYVRGNGPDGALVTFHDPDGKRPQDSDIESSVAAGLSVIYDKLREPKLLQNLLVQNSHPIELSEVVDVIKHDTYDDLRGTCLWQPCFEFPNRDLLALPGMEKMQVRVIGPGAKPAENPVDALLALASYNVELHLSRTFSCDTTSSSSPIGDLLEIKARRLAGATVKSANLWSLLEVNGIPELGEANLADKDTLADFLRTRSTRNAEQFREWFHKNGELKEREVLREYISLLREVPWVQSLPLKVLRFVVTTGLGFIPPIGQVVSFLDTFMVEKVFRGRSPRFFVDDLSTFYGRIKLQQNQYTRSLRSG